MPEGRGGRLLHLTIMENWEIGGVAAVRNRSMLLSQLRGPTRD